MDTGAIHYLVVGAEYHFRLLSMYPHLQTLGIADNAIHHAMINLDMG